MAINLSKIDKRKAAEAGRFLQLKDTTTGEPLCGDDGAPVGVILRGTSSPTYQRILGERIAAARKDAKKKADAAEVKKKAAEAGEAVEDDGPSDEEVIAIAESTHRTQMNAAEPYVVRLVGISDDDGTPLGADPEHIRALLNASFPIVSVKMNPDGTPAKDADGGFIWEPRNNPYARQIIEAAADEAGFLALPAAP